MTCNVELFLFLMYHWPFLCFLLRNICSRSLCILIFLCYWVVWVGVEYQPFKWCMIWKPFLPVCGLLLTPLIVSGTKEKHCWISFVCAFILLSFIVCAFPSFLRNLCPTSKPWSFLLLFFFFFTSNCMNSHLELKTFSYFEFVLVYAVFTVLWLDFSFL